MNDHLATPVRAVWSTRHLELYLTCPRQYRYACCDKIAVRPTAALLFGRTMHETLHRLHGQSLQREAWPRMEEAKREFNCAWSDAVAREKPLFKGNGLDAAEYQVLAAQMLERFLERQRSRPLPLASTMVFEVGSDANDYSLSGSIDLVEEDEEGVTLLDVTTATRKFSPAQMADDLTFTAYALAARHIMGGKNVKLLRFHLRDGSCGETSRSAEECDRLEGEVLPQVVRAVEAGAFPPQSGYWCRFCSYQERCLNEEMVEETMKAGEASCAS